MGLICTKKVPVMTSYFEATDKGALTVAGSDSFITYPFSSHSCTVSLTKGISDAADLLLAMDDGGGGECFHRGI